MAQVESSEPISVAAHNLVTTRDWIREFPFHLVDFPPTFVSSAFAGNFMPDWNLRP